MGEKKESQHYKPTNDYSFTLPSPKILIDFYISSSINIPRILK